MAGGWGGKRPNSGPKRKTRTQRWLDGNAGKRGMTLVSAPGKASVAVSEEIPAPAVLTEDEAKYWALWAPAAVSRGLLTQETRAGFVLLCQTARRAATMWSDIEARGLMYEKVTIDGAGNEQRDLKAHPLLSHWRALYARTEQLQARYGLAADGKVMVSAPVDDEEAELANILATG